MKLSRSGCWVVVVSIYASALYGQAVPYTNYELDERTATTETGALSESHYVAGPAPWDWYSGPDHPAAPFWNANSMIEDEFILTGPPAISIPMGNVSGLPVRLQVIGPRDRDYRVLSMAAAFEQRLGFDGSDALI